MMDFYRDYVKAAAECTGTDTYQFIYRTILAAIKDAERKLGLEASELVKLNRSERARLAEKYQLVAGAIECTSQTWRAAGN
jgi:S-methylmethionine-dependent homocysteine/selenocysteine methylase